MSLRSPGDRGVAQRGIRIAWKSGVFVVGVALVLVGTALLVLPGPGLLVIALGLGVLASEFRWARRLWQRAKDRLPRPGRRTPPPG